MAIVNDLAESSTFGVPTVEISAWNDDNPATYGSAVVFVAEDLEITQASETYTQKDGNGETTGNVIVAQQKELSCTVQLHDHTVPAVGDKLEVTDETGTDYIVTEVGRPHSQDSEKKLSISAIEKQN
jgi:hypothetical protein